MVFQGRRTASMALLLLVGATPFGSAQDICKSETNTFTAQVDLFASELGYYKFEECGDMVNPTIGLEIGETYTFLQADRSNYMHPLGFAYFPDGAHADLNELEPAVVAPADGDCVVDATCPAPMYFSGDEYLGLYSNIPEVTNVTAGEEDFGLDVYEPLFFVGLADWAGMGPFSIKLRFDDEDHTDDIFYFCHIHQFMSGRIKLLKEGLPISEENVPELGYSYDMPPGPFDKKCGSFGLDDFQLPNPVCPDRFVCGTEDQDAELQSFSECIDAMDCHMLSGMTTGVQASDEAALFIHQMIPHHQNAVNMAKVLLKTDKVVCADLTNEDSQDCVLERILREIINGQNHQIQLMNGYLEAYNHPPTDNCVVELKTVDSTASTGSGQQLGRHRSLASAVGAVAKATFMMLA